MLRVPYPNRKWARPILIVLTIGAPIAFTPAAAAAPPPPPPKPPLLVSPSSVPADSEALANNIYRKLAEKEKAAVLEGARALAARADKLRTEQAALDAARAEAQSRFDRAMDAAAQELALTILVGALKIANGQDLAQWERDLAPPPTGAPGAPKPTGGSSDPAKVSVMTNSADGNLLRKSPSRGSERLVL